MMSRKVTASGLPPKKRSIICPGEAASAEVSCTISAQIGRRSRARKPKTPLGRQPVFFDLAERDKLGVQIIPARGHRGSGDFPGISTTDQQAQAGIAIPRLQDFGIKMAGLPCLPADICFYRDFFVTQAPANQA
jgi:hypothetical protein